VEGQGEGVEEDVEVRYQTKFGQVRRVKHVGSDTSAGQFSSTNSGSGSDCIATHFAAAIHEMPLVAAA